jgi:hypothetical protein
MLLAEFQNLLTLADLAFIVDYPAALRRKRSRNFWLPCDSEGTRGVAGGNQLHQD